MPSSSLSTFSAAGGDVVDGAGENISGSSVVVARGTVSAVAETGVGGGGMVPGCGMHFVWTICAVLEMHPRVSHVLREIGCI